MRLIERAERARHCALRTQRNAFRANRKRRQKGAYRRRADSQTQARVGNESDLPVNGAPTSDNFRCNDRTNRSEIANSMDVRVRKDMDVFVMSRIDDDQARRRAEPDCCSWRPPPLGSLPDGPVFGSDGDYLLLLCCWVCSVDHRCPLFPDQGR